MLNHLSRWGMDFFFTFSIFSGLCIPFLLSSIIPIHKMGKPLDTPASFQPFSLSPPASQSFLNALFYLLYSFFWNLAPFSLRQAGFRPGQSTLDQILYLSQSISDGFNKPKPGSRSILVTIDFSRAFDSVGHPALFHKLILAGLPPCFARWTQSFLSDKCACVVFQNHKSRSLRVRRGVPQELFVGPVFFSLSINIFLLLFRHLPSLC